MSAVKHFPQTIYFRKHALLVCLITLLVLASQILASAHASGHVFHDTEASCIMFTTADNLSAAGLAPLLVIRDYQFLLLQKLPPVKPALAIIPSSYLSRAPPTSF